MERPNLINSQNHWMNDLQSTFLVLSASFSSNNCCFSSGNSVWDNFKNRSLLISLRFRVCVAVFIHEKDNWQCFPPFCHATFQHALITCCNVSRPSGVHCFKGQMEQGALFFTAGTVPWEFSIFTFLLVLLLLDLVRQISWWVRWSSHLHFLV